MFLLEIYGLGPDVKTISIIILISFEFVANPIYIVCNTDQPLSSLPLVEETPEMGHEA